MSLTNKKISSIIEELRENSLFDNQSQAVLDKYFNQENPNEENLSRVIEELTTIRNRNLITYKQQQVLENKTVAFFGLSVGSHAALTWNGIARPYRIEISDPDTISASNLNRLRLALNTIGRSKVSIIKKQIKDLNPKCEIYSLTSPLMSKMTDFLNHEPRIDAIVDEVDSIQAKIAARLWARDNRIPVLSATDVGNSVILDIERYDIDQKLAIFNGRIGEDEAAYAASMSEITPQQRISLVKRIVGTELHSPQMLESLSAIGKKIKTWPQLHSTACIAGGCITSSLIKIFLNEKVKSGRYFFDLDTILSNPYSS